MQGIELPIAYHIKGEAGKEKSYKNRIVGVIYREIFPHLMDMDSRVQTKEENEDSYCIKKDYQNSALMLSRLISHYEYRKAVDINQN